MGDLTATFIAKTRETNRTVWIGSTNNKGYGLIKHDGRIQLAHRVAYEAEYGPIPEGHVIDHLCRVRNCVNPMHLEAVSTAENTRRGRSARTLHLGDSCINGHLLADDADMYVRPNGVTECRECRRSGASRATGRRRPTVQRRADRVASDLRQVDGGAA